MSNQTVLISGGGIAGSTLACWLEQNKFQPTVVERSTGLRSSGSPVDVKGPLWMWPSGWAPCSDYAKPTPPTPTA